MLQTFEATIFNGEVDPSHTHSALELVLLHSVKNKRRNHQFLRYLHSELLECQFIPEALADPDFSRFKNLLENTHPRFASSVEILDFDSDEFGLPKICATAYFQLSVKRLITDKDWPEILPAQPSIGDAVNFYWAWPTENGLGDPENLSLSDRFGSQLCPLRSSIITFGPSRI
jgi:hypothetical protein